MRQGFAARCRAFALLASLLALATPDRGVLASALRQAAGCDATAYPALNAVRPYASGCFAFMTSRLKCC